MATVVLNFVKNLWPFSSFISDDDLRASDRLVDKLGIPESTKRFVYAVQDSNSGSIVYVLCVQNLSERSALDAEILIREVRPEAVIAQVGGVDTGDEVLGDGVRCKVCDLKGNGCSCGRKEFDLLPTSSLGVLKKCFVHKINREMYENVAGNVVVKEIFGVDFNGHFLSAKKAAEEVGASFLCLESPFVVKCGGGGDENQVEDRDSEVGNPFSGLGLQLNCCVPTRMYSKGGWSLMGSFGMNSVESQMIKSMSFSLLDSGGGVIRNQDSYLSRPAMDYEPPQFAQSIYPLFVDLHSIFNDIPSMDRALAHAQKMFVDINNGRSVDTHLLSEVYVFQIAVEGLRIALNHAGRLPVDNSWKSSSAGDFAELPIEEKSHALVAVALKSQTKSFKSVVAIIDAKSLSGLRKHWKTETPYEIKDIVEQLVTDCVTHSKLREKNRLLSDKPVVAIGAGATAVLGASSLSKMVPVSTYTKILTFKILPSSLKLVLSQTQKVLAFAFGNTAGPSKLVATGIKANTWNAFLSAEKIRTIAHGVIASVERTSLAAMRTAFYEIMRKRRVRPIGVLPWATFGCSIATCGGLVAYGDGIECAAESFPSANSIASLGRGIRNLHEANETVRISERSRIQESIEALLYRFRRRNRLYWG